MLWRAAILEKNPGLAAETLTVPEEERKHQKETAARMELVKSSTFSSSGWLSHPDEEDPPTSSSSSSSACCSLSDSSKLDPSVLLLTAGCKEGWSPGSWGWRMSQTELSWSKNVSMLTSTLTLDLIKAKLNWRLGKPENLLFVLNNLL